MNQKQERQALLALLLGNFVIGTGVLLPAGMLTELVRDLGVSAPTAGSLMLASGVVVAIGAPLTATLTSGIDRRWLLTISMILYAACHLASTIAPSFATLFAIRFLLAIPAAIFTPQAAATVGALLPPERRAAAISMIFIGWSLASVAGVPLGGYVGHAIGWRPAMLIVAALSAVSALAVWITLPGKVVTPPLNVSAWKKVLTSKALMTVLLVTVLNGTGQFTLFTYLTSSINASLSHDPGIITLILAWYGIAATFGNMLASRGVDLIGAPRSAMITLLAMAIGMIAWGLLSGSLPGALAAASIWGLGTFATMSVQQARLAGIAPQLTSASIALNSSAIYFGQAAGSSIGGTFISQNLLSLLPFAGAAILVLAALVSVLAERWEPENAILEPQSEHSEHKE